MRVEVDPVETLALKGKSERVPACRLTAIREAGEGHARLDSPMVGREKELDFRCAPSGAPWQNAPRT